MTIPKHWFQFVTKSHLIELGEKPPYYPGIQIPVSFYIIHITHIITLIMFLDFIGVLPKIKDCRKQNDEPYVFLFLTDSR